MKNPTIIAGLLNFKDMTKVMQIPLTQGKVALVDKADFHKVNKYRWVAMKVRKNFYAVTHIYGNNAHAVILMHRLILGVKDSKIHVDHKDHNGLNNVRNNIRKCTVAQNMANMRLSNRGTSKYKGVNRIIKNSKKYTAYIGKNGKKTYLGSFLIEKDAALAYNKAAIKQNGEFACINKI